MQGCGWIILQHESLLQCCTALLLQKQGSTMTVQAVDQLLMSYRAVVGVCNSICCMSLWAAGQVRSLASESARQVARAKAAAGAGSSSVPELDW
jgi:hypothetical protein